MTSKRKLHEEVAHFAYNGVDLNFKQPRRVTLQYITSVMTRNINVNLTDS